MCGNLIVSKGSLYVYLFELNLRNLLYVINVLMTLAKQHDFVTTKVVAEAAGMPEATTRRYLAKFSKMDIIVSDGKNRSKKYYLKNISMTEANP